MPRLIALLLLSLTAAAPAPAQPPPARAVPVRTAPVVARPVVDAVRFIASVEPSVSTRVAAEVAGAVVEVPAREGDRVVAGRTVLARLDLRPRQLQQQEAEAAVARARETVRMLEGGYRAEEVAQRAAELAEQAAILDREEREFRRAEHLYREQLISLAEVDRARAAYEAARQRHRRAVEGLRMAEAGPRPEEIAQARADLAAARARLDRILDELRRSVVVAPITGHVVRKHVEVGAWVQPGTAVADLIALDPVEVTGPVGEREIRLVQVGQPAEVTVDAQPGRVFEGRVVAVVPGADPASRTFPVKVAVANPEDRLKAGMFARVTVRTGGGRTGLFVPKDAVVRRGGQEFVFLVEGGTARLVRVQTRLELDGLVEVEGPGLAAGRPAVTLGNEFLQPGTPVSPTP